MPGFSALCRRHQVKSGPLVHVGNAQGREIPEYYEAGFTNITVVESAPDRVRALRTRFPGVDVQEVTGEVGFRLDAACPLAHVAVVNIPGHELAVLEFAPWDSLRLLIVVTSASDNSAGASSYDLLTEVATTRGFVEVDRWKRTADADLDVAFVKLGSGRDEHQ
jgi:hypothetical protein